MYKTLLHQGRFSTVPVKQNPPEDYLSDSGDFTSLHVLFSIDYNLFKTGQLASCYDITIGAGGVRFEFQVGQIRHSVANGLPPLRRFFGATLPSR